MASPVLSLLGSSPLSGGPDPVYQALYPRVCERNDRYFERFPMDRERFGDIIEFLEKHPTRLPSGTHLTPDVFRQIGMALSQPTVLKPSTIS